MGYLDNSSITVDAILTKKGRELLARGRDEFKVTHFALADDEVDYDLYNTEHPLSVPQFIGDDEAAQSITVTGFEFEIVAKEQLINDKSATLLIIGNETGGRASITLTAKKLQVATTMAAPTIQGS